MPDNKPTMRALLKNLRDYKVATKKPHVLEVKPPPVQAPVEEAVVENPPDEKRHGALNRLVNMVFGR